MCASKRGGLWLMLVAMAVGACKEPAPASPVTEPTGGANSSVSAAGSVSTGEGQAVQACAEKAEQAQGEQGQASAQQAQDQPVEPMQVPPPIVDDEPLPNVTVKKIGLHIGGGPHDDETKRPIIESVKPHFDAMRGCWRHVQEPGKVNDFGVDLLIEREGGKAQVSNPRTAIKGDEFRDCMMKVFEGIEFLRPRTGKTIVSYSVRFTPGK